MLFEKLQEAVKSAMKNGNTVERDCLRSVISEIKNQTVNAGKEITEEICLKVIQKSAKTHNDSITQFKSAGRNDLVEKEEAELKILENYLPKMLSEEETKTLIDNILQNVEAVKKNMGLVMKQLPKEVDRKLASKYLNSVLK